MKSFKQFLIESIDTSKRETVVYYDTRKKEYAPNLAGSFDFGIKVIKAEAKKPENIEVKKIDDDTMKVGSTWELRKVTIWHDEARKTYIQYKNEPVVQI